MKSAIFVVAAFAAVLVVASSSLVEAQACSKQICEKDPVCSFHTFPYRCAANGTTRCLSSAAQCTKGDVCDARSCATPHCKATCPFEVCRKPTCPLSATFVCFEGQQKGACGQAPSFLNDTSCMECCDLRTCPHHGPTTTPAPFQKSCKNVKCPAQDCAPWKCGSAAPYMCIMGPSARGCSANPTSWPQNPTACSECCDTRTCLQNCTVCDAASPFCNNPGKDCPPQLPFTCTAGASKGACAATSKYWANNGQDCSACCKCPPKILGSLKKN